MKTIIIKYKATPENAIIKESHEIVETPTPFNSRYVNGSFM
jgi:hypothetical protein